MVGIPARRSAQEYPDSVELLLSLATVTLSLKLVRDFLERRGDDPARAAPFGPEINQNRPVRPQNVGRETLIGDGLGGHERIS